MAFQGAISPLEGHRFRANREDRAVRGAEREGVLSVHPRGFGFVACVGFDDDLYVTEESMGGAMHGDRVRARVVADTRRGSEGEVLRVLARANPRVVGVVRRRGKALWLEPDDTRIRGPIVLTAKGETAGARDGDAVVAKVTRFPEMPRETPEAELEQ